MADAVTALNQLFALAKRRCRFCSISILWLRLLFVVFCVLVFPDEASISENSYRLVSFLYRNVKLFHRAVGIIQVVPTALLAALLRCTIREAEVALDQQPVLRQVILDSMAGQQGNTQ